uniref:Uncharacterized protein n=1 Tax=Anguilla anguilla TaxID=7936 RepID=A0A0E9QK93_ANGAN
MYKSVHSKNTVTCLIA